MARTELTPTQRQILEVERQLSFNQLYRYKPYAKQREFHHAGANPGVKERLLIAGNQLGKGSPLDEPVLTPSGWQPIGSLKVGDDIIAGDGSVTQVTGVFPRGELPLVEVEFCYGAKVRVDPEHLWYVQTPQTRFRTTSETIREPGKKRYTVQVPNPRYGEWEVLTTAEMRAKYGDKPNPKYRYATPAVGACELAAQPTPVDPYVLGLLLGDGCLRRQLSYASMDPELAAAVAAELARFGGSLKQVNRCNYRARGARAFTDELEKIGVLDHLADSKRVPQAYLWNAPAARLAVLQGLMDTDGTCEKSGVTTFTSISEGLAEDVVFLARSFGGKCETRSRVTSYTYKGEKKQGRRSYTVVIRLPHVPLFRLQRKLDRYVRPTSTSDHNIIVGFKDLAPAEVVCISVAHPSRLYVTKDFIVTHNTLSASRETAMHLTGMYPEWWTGAKFRRPTTGWAASLTSQGTRDTVQRLLLGPPGQHGTGAIPKKSIIDIKKATHGVADAVETITVRHEPTGGTSRLTLKTYDQGRERWQGDTLNFLWLDEECPMDIYVEGLTRLVATGGIAYMTFTPLLGMSGVVRRFLQEKPPGTHVTNMTIEDAEHYTPEERAAIIARWPAHERDARARGIPMLGSGAIYPVDIDSILEPALQIPEHWPRIAGIDFGWDHPTAIVWMAWDRDNDVIHVYDVYRKKEATPIVHAAALRSRGVWIPVAWPHDGLNTEKGSGIVLAQQYRDQGANMLKTKATHPPAQGQKEGDGGNGVEAGVQRILDRMLVGKFKVARHLSDWIEECRMYHRDNGLIVKEADDLMDATRYAEMMIRFAKTRAVPRQDVVRPFTPLDSAMGALG